MPSFLYLSSHLSHTKNFVAFL